MIDSSQFGELLIEPGSPWENGCIELFNGKLRDELLNGEIFDTLTEARIVTEKWRRFHNSERIHSSFGYRPPAPETFYQIQLANLPDGRQVPEAKPKLRTSTLYGGRSIFEI